MRNKLFSKTSVCKWAVVATVLTCGLAIPPASTAQQPHAPSADQKSSEVSRSINRFASDLHGKLPDDENQVVSPASISTALAMAYSGAAGKTATQIAATMHFESTPEKLPAAFADFQPGKPVPSQPEKPPVSYSFGAEAENNARYGLKVLKVIADSPAAKIGLRENDLILSIDEEPIRNTDQYVSCIDDSGGKIEIRWFNFERGTVLSQSVQLKAEPATPPVTVALKSEQPKADPSESKPATRLEMVNAVWVQKTYPFSDKYLGFLRDGYRAFSREVDFQEDPAYSCNLINDWVKKNTDGRIQKLLTEDAISADSRLVLTNTLYFQGLWEHPFPDNPETLQWKTGNQTKSVPSMSRKETFNYKENDLYQAVELPYQDSHLAMVLLLPKPEISWEKFCSTLRTSGFGKALTGFEKKPVEITMPKFRIETKLSLKEILSPSMPLAFMDSDETDFSPMVEGDGRLKISAVVHQAFIDVDNLGTKAGAATVAAFVTKNQRPVIFEADRPFVFALHDRNSKAILFLGHLVHPEG